MLIVRTTNRRPRGEPGRAEAAPSIQLRCTSLPVYHLIFIPFSPAPDRWPEVGFVYMYQSDE